MWALLGNPSRPPRAKGELPSLLLRLTNFLSYLFLILVNILSATGALGGTNAEVSTKFQTPLTPAGWAFAIWGIIFALEGLGVIYQVVNSGYREGGWKTSVVMKIGYGWQVGWLFQDLWQFFFVRQSVPGMWLAAAALLGALAAFQVTLHRLNGTTHELRARGYPAMPVAAYFCYKLPTAVNAAWLSVAAALGLLIVPISYGVEQARLVAPAAVLAVAVTAGGLWRLIRHRDAAYGLTLIWALAAVAANDSGNVPTAVKVVGIVCLAVLALFVVAALVRTRRELSAAAAAGVEGSLLHNTYNACGLYGDQRTLLSDSDAPAGYGRNAGSFTFPADLNSIGRAAHIGAAAPEGVTAAAAGHKSTAAAPLFLSSCAPSGGAIPKELGRHQQHPLGAAQSGGDGGEVARVSFSGAAMAGPPRTVTGLPAALPRPQGQALGTETTLGEAGPAVVAGRRVRFSDEDARNDLQ